MYVHSLYDLCIKTKAYGLLLILVCSTGYSPAINALPNNNSTPLANLAPEQYAAQMGRLKNLINTLVNHQAKLSEQTRKKIIQFLEKMIDVRNHPNLSFEGAINEILHHCTEFKNKCMGLAQFLENHKKQCSITSLFFAWKAHKANLTKEFALPNGHVVENDLHDLLKTLLTYRLSQNKR